jgi:hypothetical protein
MAEQPPLNRSYVISYAANDRDFPTIGLRADPRVAGYRVPEDLSPHPDSKRYPNHVFTGSQPSNGDERVTHIYEILPSPWVPFTRYDDDLGPIQGRRRAVKNENQQASLATDKKVSYEGREGSAIVSNEIEETWSIKTDEDGNSLFPIRDRDFYDASRGPVQERRQLFVPTGEEEGSLENINGIITQTSYEPYNEFLSVKIVQTYKVDGPQLIGRATDNDGQLVTITTQRKGADGYVPPNPTATRTVEVSREDAESLVERIVDTPEVFTAKTFSVERPDPIPQKFRVAVPLQSEQEVIAGEAELPTLLTGEISRTEEQRNKFLKRTTATSRDQSVLPKTLIQKATDNDRQEVTITETLQLGNTSEKPTATTTIESEALGDGNFVIRKTQVPEVFSAKTFQKTKDDLTPQKFRGAQESNTIEENVAGTATAPKLSAGEFAKSEQQINKFVKRVSTTSRAITSAVTLGEKVLTPEGLIGSRVLTLASGDQSFTPSAKMIDASVEALGDGRTVKTETTIQKIFDGKSIRKSKPDLTPEKFRAKQEEFLTEENVEGIVIENFSLEDGEFSKTEQQITEFVKRISTTSRDITAAVSLEESVLTPQGQLATRIIRLADGPQTINPSATLIDASVEELGDGRTIKTEINVPVVFDEKQQSLQKPDFIPVEFRASLPDLTEVTVKSGTEATVGSLEENEVAKSVQRVTEDKIRETKTTRQVGPYPQLTEQIVDNDGLVITRTKTVVDGQQQISVSATRSGSVQALGDGFTLKTQDTKSKIFRGQTFSSEKPDNIPVEFRAEKPAITEEFNEVGTATNVTLFNNEIAKSEQQITEFVKRTRKTTRDLTNSAILTGEQIDENGLKAVVTRTLSNGVQSIEPSAFVSGQVEDIGDGKTIKTEITKDEVFSEKVLSVERPETIPAAFRAEKPIKINEETVEGEIEEELQLEETELSKSEQQVTKFTKRKRTTSRDDIDGTQLTDERINEFKQRVIITRTVDRGTQVINPSATISGNVESLGNGYTLKTEEEIGEIFEAKTVSTERPDPAPQKFRIELPLVTKQSTIEGEVEESLSLNNDEISKSEQQIDDFVKRISTTSRDDAPSGTLVGKQTGTWGAESVTETYSEDETLEVGYSILSNRKTPLGGGKYIGEKIQVDSPAPLIEYKQDPETKTLLRVEKSLIQGPPLSPQTIQNGSIEHQSIDVWNTIQIITSVQKLPDEEVFETTMNYRYPDVLREAGINWEVGKDTGSENDGVFNADFIRDNGLSWNFGISTYGSSTLRGSAYVKIEQGYSGPVRCRVTRKYYLNPPSNTPQIYKWNPAYGSITINGIGRFLKSGINVSGTGDTRLKEARTTQLKSDTFANTIVFGPVLQDGIQLQNETPDEDTFIQIESSSNSDLPDRGAFPRSFTEVGSNGVATLHIGSTATPPSSGFENVGMVNVEKWRFGIWIEEVYKVFHP